MGESLTERRRVSEEGPMGCKALSDWEENLAVNTREAWRYHQRKHRLTPCQQPR